MLLLRCFPQSNTSEKCQSNFVISSQWPHAPCSPSECSPNSLFLNSCYCKRCPKCIGHKWWRVRVQAFKRIKHPIFSLNVKWNNILIQPKFWIYQNEALGYSMFLGIHHASPRKSYKWRSSNNQHFSGFNFPYNRTMKSTTPHFSSKRSICRFSTNVYIISKSSTFKRRHKWKGQPNVTFQSCRPHINHTSLQHVGLTPHIQVIPLDLYQLSHKYKCQLML